MQRFLRILLAFAISSNASGITFGDTSDYDSDDDAPDALISSPVRRTSPSRATAQGQAFGLPADVLIVPADVATREPVTWNQPADGRLVIEHRADDVAVLRNLNVAAPQWAHAVMTRLLEAALDDCRARGDLKVVIDLPLGREHVAAICRRHHFNYFRSTRRAGRLVHECYTDLYTAEPDDEDDGAAPPPVRNA